MQEHRDRPLSALLSQILVAYTVEFDNEFERRMNESGYVGARLSLVVWSNLIRFVSENAISVRDLAALALAEPTRIRHVLGCLERWGFVALDADSHESRSDDRSAKRPGFRNVRDGWGSGRGIAASWTVRLTVKGLKAREIWPLLFDPIEQRWRTRFGAREIDGLRESLHSVVAKTEFQLPEGLVDVRNMAKPFPAKVKPNTSHLSLPALLSRTLLVFALEFEPQSAAPLALCANGLRILAEKPIRERDIPLLTGGSPEVTGIGWQLKPYIVVEPDLNAKRGKMVRLNARGLEAQRDYQHLLRKIEKSWELRFTREKIHTLRSLLLSLFDRDKENHPRISQGLVSPPGVVRSGEMAPALGRRDVGAAARQRMRDLVAQTESFISDPAGTLPHYPIWDMNRGYGP